MKANEKEILRFFEGADTIFKIPVYQRNYDWRATHCKKLIDDINFAQESNLSYYFIGSIVYIDYKKNKDGCDERLIIDGQQRLTTLSLILIAIRDLTNNKELSEKINERYLINKYIKGDNERIKLKPIKDDYDAFSKILNQRDTLMSESQVTKNYRYIRNILSALEEKALEKFSETLNKLFVVEIALEKEKDDPQVIFESINSTGLGLEQSDLVRNFILMKQVKQEELYEKYWHDIEKNTSYSVSSFIRDYLTLKNAIIPNESDVYIDFKKYVFQENHHNDIEVFLSELRKHSGYYKKILTASSGNKKIDMYLKAFLNLKITVSYPFLLGLFLDMDNKLVSEEEAVKILRYIETYVVRRAVCMPSNKAPNKFFMTLSKDIHKYLDQGGTYYEIVKYLINKKEHISMKLPKNHEFGENFISCDIYSMKHFKNHIFEKIENHEKRNIRNFEETSIEHIMPKTLTGNWKKDLGENWEEIYNKYIDTIGNLTLMHKGDNSAIQNSVFSVKRAYIIENTDYSMSNYFKQKNITQWDETEIIHRANEIKETALQIWKFEESDFVPKEEEDNIFFLDDIEDYEDLQGSKIESYKLLDTRKTVKNSAWRQLLKDISNELYEYNTPLFKSLVENKTIPGSTSILFTNKKEELAAPLEFTHNCFVEGKFSSRNILKIIEKLLEIFNIDRQSLELKLGEPK